MDQEKLSKKVKQKIIQAEKYLFEEELEEIKRINQINDLPFMVKKDALNLKKVKAIRENKKKFLRECWKKMKNEIPKMMVKMERLDMKFKEVSCCFKALTFERWFSSSCSLESRFK